jgi:hypothetical protein
MSESELLRKILKTRVWRRDGETKIELANPKNLQEIITIHVPRELMPNVQNWLRNPRLMQQPEEWDKIKDYVLEYMLALMKMDLKASSPVERKLKIAVFEQFMKELDQEQKKE